MPKMVQIEVDPAFKAAPGDTATLAAAKKEGRVRVSFQTALENIKQSNGMYRIVPDEDPVVAPKAQAIEDMDRNSLLAMAVSLGMKTEKVMKTTDLVRYVKGRLDQVEIVE